MLVEDWREAPRWISVNCMTMAAAIQGTWLYIPPELKSSIPPSLVSGVTIGLLVLGVIGRFFKQKPKRKIKCK